MIESMNNLLIYENEDDEYDEDDEYEDSNILYDSDEECSTKYTIILCDLYNPNIHGDCEYFVLCQFLVHCKYKYFDVNFINSTCNYLNKQYKLLISQDQNKINHPIYKNYLNIISRNNYIKPEIAQCIYLNSYECIAILKTFWIRLIQRTWKKVYKERQNIINKKFQLSAIRNREINYNFIRYPTFPSLKGMMYYLKK